MTAAPASSTRSPATATARSPSWRRPATNITMVDPGPANQRIDFRHELRGPARHRHHRAAHPEERPAGHLARDRPRRADGERHPQHRGGSTRLSDQDGAGGLAADRAAGIVENTPAWNGVRFDCSTPRTLDLTTRSVGRRTPTVSPSRGPPIRRSPTTRNSPSADIDLQVVDRHGVIVATSASFDNTSEIVEFDSRGRRHLHRPGYQLPLRSQHVPRLGVGHVVDAAAEGPVTTAVIGRRGRS